MKRLLAAALVLACAVGLTSQASAAVRWDIGNPLRFVTSVAANVGGTTGVDTLYSCGTAARNDTTQAFSLLDAMNAAAMFSAATATRDSIPYLGVYVHPSPGSSVGMDSVYIGLQLSMDGANWVSVTPTQTFLAGTTIPAIASVALLELASSNTVGIIYKQNIANTANAIASLLQEATAPSNLQLFGFQYGRVILTSFDATGCLAIRIGHWKEVD